jgi:hypothetical protein
MITHQENTRFCFADQVSALRDCVDVNHVQYSCPVIIQITTDALIFGRLSPPAHLKEVASNRNPLCMTAETFSSTRLELGDVPLASSCMKDGSSASAENASGHLGRSKAPVFGSTSTARLSAVGQEAW